MIYRRNPLLAIYSDGDKRTGLMLAGCVPSLDVVKLLVEAGANLFVVDYNKKRAKQCAMLPAKRDGVDEIKRAQYDAVVKYLEKQENLQVNPLIIVVESGDLEAVRKKVEDNEHLVNKPDFDDRTP